MPGPALGATAATGGGFPWSIALMLIPSLLADLFGENEEEQMMNRAMQMRNIMRMMGMKQPYQSPYTGTADRALIELILGRLGKMGSWGYPAGMGLDMGFLGDLPSRVRRRETGDRTRIGG